MIENPVLIKELRIQMRGQKAFVIVGVYNLVLLCVATLWGVSQLLRSTVDYNYYAGMGRDLFYLIMNLQMGLVCLISPAFTAGAITLERGQQTFEMLICTLIKPSAIILGKIGSALLYLLLLLGGSLPLICLLFVLGGFSPGEVIMSYYVMLVASVLFSFSSLMFSTLFRKTAIAQVFSFGFMLVITVVTIALGDFVNSVSRRGVYTCGTCGYSVSGAAKVLIDLNPFIGLASITERGPYLAFKWFSSEWPAWAYQSVVFGLLTILFYYLSLCRLRRTRL